MNLLRLNKQSFGSAQIWASQTGLLSCVDLIMTKYNFEHQYGLC